MLTFVKEIKKEKISSYCLTKIPCRRAEEPPKKEKEMNF
jgi:hypothetical protein